MFLMRSERWYYERWRLRGGHMTTFVASVFTETGQMTGINSSHSHQHSFSAEMFMDFPAWSIFSTTIHRMLYNT